MKSPATFHPHNPKNSKPQIFKSSKLFFTLSLFHLITLSLIHLLTFGQRQQQRPVNQALFDHAVAAPDSVEQSFSKLAAYLSGPATSPKETVESIFYWTAVNIAYYNDPHFDPEETAEIAIHTLMTKKSGCEGTARLFYELCTAAGVECEVVFGIAQGYGGYEGRTSSNHGWNAVNIDGKWELIDATWGGGGSTKVDGKIVHVKELDMRYLFADPSDFIIDHFPEQKKWQLLDEPISKKEFFSDFYDLKRMAKFTRYGN